MFRSFFAYFPPVLSCRSVLWCTQAPRFGHIPDDWSISHPLRSLSLSLAARPGRSAAPHAHKSSCRGCCCLIQFRPCANAPLPLAGTPAPPPPGGSPSSTGAQGTHWQPKGMLLYQEEGGGRGGEGAGLTGSGRGPDVCPCRRVISRRKSLKARTDFPTTMHR